ncbi:hypothetical protein [Chitinophaga rhizosphaerae]|uniref:hypothetical protein n=1 Tax=Chitinophaga rhizosphaerae TaxID=1864947 RepID=UPI000F80FE19|nr:hypothetical protein [Chitinophaga rhizosphaerae]
MKYLISILILLAGCRTTKDPSAAEREALRAVLGEHLDSLQLAPPLTLQGEAITIETRGSIPDFDSGAVKSKSGRLTVKCPDKTLNLDSILRNNRVFLAMVTAWKLAEARKDSTARENAVYKADNARLTKGKRAADLRFWLLAGAVLVWLIIKFKTGGLGFFKLFKK